MKKRAVRKLSLNRQTLYLMTIPDARRAAGGDPDSEGVFVSQCVSGCILCNGASGDTNCYTDVSCDPGGPSFSICVC